MRAGERFAAGAMAIALGVGCTNAESLPLGAGIQVQDLIDFGNVAVGHEASVTLSITNQSSSPLRITGAVAGPDFSTNAYAFRLVDVPQEVRDRAQMIVTFQPYSSDVMAESSFTLITDTGEARVRLLGRAGDFVTIDPLLLDFGEVLRGDQKELTVTMRAGSMPVSVRTPVDSTGRILLGGVEGDGTFAIFPQVSTAGDIAGASPIPADGTAEFRVRYTPADNPRNDRPDRARLLLRTCENPICDVELRMSGIGTDQAVRCDSTTVEFGSLAAGEEAAATVHCTIVAGAGATLEQIAIAPSNVGFTAEADRPLPVSLGANTPFDIVFHARPTRDTEGSDLTARATITGWIPATGRALAPVEIDLHVQSGRGQLEVVPAALDFGRVAVGTQNTLSFLLINRGARPVHISSIRSANTSFTTDESAASLGPGETLPVQVTFEPTAAGTASAELVIVSDVTDTQELRVPLIGEGVEIDFCRYALSYVDLDFGTVRVGHHVEHDLWITNIGSTDCLLHSIELLPGTAQSFALVSAPSGDPALAPGDSRRLTAAFNPTAERVEHGAIGFYISSAAQSNARIEMRGAGSMGEMIVAPEVLDFGTIDVGCTDTSQVIRVRNAADDESDAPITLAFAEILPASSSFEIVSPLPGPNTNILPLDAFELQIRYRPAGVGRHHATLRLREANRIEPYLIPLTGEVVAGGLNEERTTQPEHAPVDVLFVVDNGWGMMEEQEALATNFAAFELAARTTQADYQLAVISTTAEIGQLNPCPESSYPPANLPLGDCGYFAGDIITADTLPSPEEAFSANVHLGTGSTSFSHGLTAAQRALSPLLLAGRNSGFFRDHASLALVFVSDKEDFSPGPVQHYYDEFALLKGFRHLREFSVSAIVGNAPGGCATAGDGGRYIDLVARTGGHFESVCTSDWTSTIEQLGASLFGYRSTVTLPRAADSATLEVLVDGVSIPRASASGQTHWTYDSTTHTVSFAPLSVPEPGSEIVVRYGSACL